jgi:hypothetical protein
METTRRELVETWKGTADQLHQLAGLESQVARLRAAADPGSAEVLAVFEAQIATDFKHLRDMVLGLRSTLDR